MLFIAGYFAYIRGWIFIDFESITPREIHSLLEKHDDNITILDVRSVLEFDREHIKDAKVIPLNILSNSLKKLNHLKNKKIIVYCHSGSRSIQASRILKAEGFTPINMKGGLIDYKKEGFTLIKAIK